MKNLSVKQFKAIQTKRRTYIQFEGKMYFTNNDWSNHNFTEVEKAETPYSPENWKTFEAATLADAYQVFIADLKQKSEEGKIRNERLHQESIERKKMQWESIKDLDPIPATADNIRIILQHLNDSNWGGWNLPKLSIGYKANQFDCDGKTAATITLDKPISDDDYGIRNETKFVVGAPHGHLNKYQRL